MAAVAATLAMVAGAGGQTTLSAATSVASSSPASGDAPRHAARAIQTDRRWLGWLGCWQNDPNPAAANRRSDTAPGAATCVIPVAGSSGVEMLTIARGKVVTRDRLDASAPPHSINGQGCQGSENMSWSSTEHRVFLRSDFTCTGGNRGTSLTVDAVSPEGEWLHVEEVRAGSGGAVITVDHRSPASISSLVSEETASAIASEQRAITMARAAAATPITADEIIDAIQRLDAGVVKSWLAVSDESFNFTGQDLAKLARADVPSSVLQTIMAGGAGREATAAATRETDAYLNRPAYPMNSASFNNGPTYIQGPASSEYSEGGQCPPEACGLGQPYMPYSSFNGYNPGFGYPYNPYAFGSPFGFGGSVLVVNSNGRNNGHQQNNHQHGPVGVHPVGTGGAVVVGGGGRRR